jgi:hypothetical protein
MVVLSCRITALKAEKSPPALRPPAPGADIPLSNALETSLFR